MGVGTTLSGPEGVKAQSKSTIGQSELEQLGIEVLKRLSKEGIPPLPIHYEVFFEKVLEEKPAAFVKSVTEQMELEEEGLAERGVVLEKKLKQGVATTKEILQNIAYLYKALTALQETINKRSAEVSGLANPGAIANITSQLSSEVQKTVAILKNNSNQLKELYSKSLSIVKEAESETVYDSFFGIYNSRYFNMMVEREVKNLARFHYQCSVMVLCLKESVAREIGLERKIMLVNRTIAKLLLKTSRRSDVIAHLGNGIFGMLLRHTDSQNAVRTAERVSDMISSTNLFFEDKEIDLKASIGIIPLEEGRTIEEIMEAATNAMVEVESSDELSYKVGSYA